MSILAIGGYDFDVQGQVIKEHECMICLQLIRDAAMLPCSHTFCLSCLEHWSKENLNGERITTNHCSVCQIPYDEEKIQRVAVLDRIITTSIKVKCKHVQCEWIGTISDFKIHEEKVCQFALQPCKNAGCRVSFNRNDMEKHMTSCVYRLTACLYCKDEMKVLDMFSHHQNQCILYPTTCPNDGCDLEIQKRQIADHLLADCEYEEIDCEFQGMGCDIKMKRKDKETHNQISMGAHMSLLLRSNVHLTRKVADTSAELSKAKEDLQSFKRSNVQLTKKVTDTSAELSKAKEDLQSFKHEVNKDHFSRNQAEVIKVLLQGAEMNPVSFQSLLLFENINHDEFLRFAKQGEYYCNMINFHSVVDKLKSEFNVSYKERYNKLLAQMESFIFYKVADNQILVKLNLTDIPGRRSAEVDLVFRKLDDLESKIGDVIYFSGFNHTGWLDRMDGIGRRARNPENFLHIAADASKNMSFDDYDIYYIYPDKNKKEKLHSNTINIDYYDGVHQWKRNEPLLFQFVKN